MRLFSRATRRRRDRDATTSQSSLSLRDEKILLALVVQTQQLNDRLTRLEDRVEAALREAPPPPEPDDLLELRMHSARLAAELSRVTIELRAEINELASGLAGVQGADAIAPPEVTDRLAPEDTDSTAEPLIDLRDRPTPPRHGRASRSSGWRPARPPRRSVDG